MTFEEYRNWQPTLASYNINGFDERGRKSQAIKEMVSEAGEVLSILTKADRKNKEIDRDKIIDEVGDTFWGITGILNEFDISLEELMNYNHKKLTDRYKEHSEKWK